MSNQLLAALKSRPSASNLIGAAPTLPTAKLSSIMSPASTATELEIEELANCIQAIGLLRPIVVDANRRVIKGSKRVAALQLLESRYPGQYSEAIPIRQLALDSTIHLAEVAEARRQESAPLDYSEQELLEIADRLRAAGYVSTRGRRAPGQKNLTVTVAQIAGKTPRHIQSIIHGKKAQLVARFSPTNSLSWVGRRLLESGTPPKVRAALVRLQATLEQAENKSRK